MLSESRLMARDKLQGQQHADPARLRGDLRPAKLRAAALHIRDLTIDGQQARTCGGDIYNPGSPYNRRMWFLMEPTDRVKLAVDIVCAANAGCARAARILRTPTFDDGARMCAIDIALQALARGGTRRQFKGKASCCR
jgi:hypothetical protein